MTSFFLHESFIYDVSGRVLDNPQTKEKITFLETTENTNGEYVSMQIVLPPGGHVPMNVHHAYSEGYEVVNGRLDVAIGEKDNQSVIEGGNKIVAEKGLPIIIGTTAKIPLSLLSRCVPPANLRSLCGLLWAWVKKGSSTKMALQKPLSAHDDCSLVRRLFTWLTDWLPKVSLQHHYLSFGSFIWL